MKKPSSGEKGVTRIDNEDKNTHGWYVRVCFNRKMYLKFFADTLHGGREKGFKKAVKYRDTLEKELGKPRTDRIIVASTKKNRCGITGVIPVFKSERVDGDKPGGLFFEVTWSPEPNVSKKKLFSASKLGEEEAFIKAVKFRQRCERKIYGRVLQPEIPPYAEVKRRWAEIDLELKRKREKRKPSSSAATKSRVKDKARNEP